MSEISRQARPRYGGPKPQTREIVESTIRDIADPVGERRQHGHDGPAALGARSRSRRGTRPENLRGEPRGAAKRLLRRSRELEREITALVKVKNPRLLEIPGCGHLTAAKLIAQTAGAERFPSHAHFARLAGVAPIPVCSGRTDRHRLDRGGDRQLNCALHRIAVTQKRMHEPAKLAQKQAEGKTNREALRCLKRQLVRKVLRTLRATPSNEENSPCVIKINNFKEPLQVAGLT